MADSFLKLNDQGIKALLYSKFATVMGFTVLDTSVLQYPKSVALRRMAEKKAEDTLEFISFWRTTTSFDWSRNRSVAHKSLPLRYTDATLKEVAVMAKALPVSLGYNFWVWTKDLNKIQHAIEKFLFWAFDDPNLTLSFENQYSLELDMHFDKEVVDESTVEKAFDIGEFFCYKFGFTLDGWIFTLSSSRTIKTIKLSIYEDVPTPILLSEVNIDADDL